MAALGRRLLRSTGRLGGTLARTFSPFVWHRRGLIAGGITAVVAIVIILFVIAWWWGEPPATFDPQSRARAMAETQGHDPVTGYVTTATLITATDNVLNKPGGYLFNDVLPPGVTMDNIPSWEYGAVVQIRDLARVLRNEMSRSQTQSREDPDLAQAEPRLHFNANSWIFPSTESEYEAGLRYLRDYRDRLATGDANFFARADNLREYLSTVGQRLGGIVQRLSASVGERQPATALADDPSQEAAEAPVQELREQTPWFEIDNEFYHARGATWALLHFLRAVRADFDDVIVDKNAEATMDQLVRALEAAQQPLGSPVVLNGHGFGFFANHSLVMASYVSRANAALIDLRQLLEQG